MFFPWSSSKGHIDILSLLHHLSLPNLLQVLSENVVVRDSSGKEIESQILPLANAYVGIRNYYVMAHLGKIPAVTPQYWLAFSASVPPLGLSTYFISKANRKGYPYNFYILKNIDGNWGVDTDLYVYVLLYTCSFHLNANIVQGNRVCNWYNSSWAGKSETYLFWEWRKTCWLH